MFKVGACPEPVGSHPCFHTEFCRYSFLGVLHAPTWEKTTYRPSIACLSVAFFLCGRQHAGPRIHFLQQWESVVPVFVIHCATITLADINARMTHDTPMALDCNRTKWSEVQWWSLVTVVQQWPTWCDEHILNVTVLQRVHLFSILILSSQLFLLPCFPEQNSVCIHILSFVLYDLPISADFLITHISISWRVQFRSSLCPLLLISVKFKYIPLYFVWKCLESPFFSQSEWPKF
jgi:hypothetical protein